MRHFSDMEQINGQRTEYRGCIPQEAALYFESCSVTYILDRMGIYQPFRSDDAA